MARCSATATFGRSGDGEHAPQRAARHSRDPHGPYEPPERLRDAFVGDEHYDASRRVPLDYRPRSGAHSNDVLGAVPRYQRLGDADVVDYYVAQYDAEIVFVDEQIGRILRYLETSGLVGETLIVLTSDHGESLGEHDYYFEHGMLVNEGSIHVPLVIADPDIVEPRVIDVLAQTTDLLPTLRQRLGFEAPDDVDGLDLSELMRHGDDDAPVRKYVYSCTPYPTAYATFYETVRTRDTKLVRSREGRMAYYDLQSDPGETTNLLASLEPSSLEQWGRVSERFGRRFVPVDRPRALPDDLRQRLEALGYSGR